jgi:uncharacterized protein (TIGR00369 family)
MTHDAADRERLDELMRESVQGFTAYIGFLPRVLEPGHCEATVEIAPHHLQQDGYVHAGVITTLADHAAGYAAYSVAPPGTRVLSVEFKINLLAPGDGDELVCRAKVLKPGRRILVVESEVFSRLGTEEKLVAKALLTMAAVPAHQLKPARRRS